jgi:predicted site-specific integrase-resolvase
MDETQRRLERAVKLMSAKPQREIVKRHDAAAMLGISTRTLQRWHRQGYGPARSRGKRFHYFKSEIEDWIATHGSGGKRKR